MLSSGEVVAVKRSKQGSMQGGLEFKTEIELLSRVHHKNLVGLVGFCFEQGEQMLVYEYISNGTLRESLTGQFIYHVTTLVFQNFSFLVAFIYIDANATTCREKWHTSGLGQET